MAGCIQMFAIGFALLFLLLLLCRLDNGLRLGRRRRRRSAPSRPAGPGIDGTKRTGLGGTDGPVRPVRAEPQHRQQNHARRLRSGMFDPSVSEVCGTDRMGSPALGFLGWRSGRTRRFASGEQESRRRRQRIEATRTAHDDKGETAGGAENGVQPDAEADTAHPRAAGQGDRSAHASDSGMFNIQMTPIHPRIRYQMLERISFVFFFFGERLHKL